MADKIRLYSCDALLRYNLVYLGTPYTKYAKGIDAAFIDAARLAAALMQAGVKVYSPIVHCHPISVYGDIDPLNHDIWLPFDRSMMNVADAMVVGMLPGWKESYGVEREIETFQSLNKPVYLVDPKDLGAE